AHAVAAIRSASRRTGVPVAGLRGRGRTAACAGRVSGRRRRAPPRTVTREVDRTMKTLACDRDKAEILRRLTALRHDSVRRWGRMSAHQMVCHLTDGYRILTGERITTPATSSLPRPLMKWIALYAPVKWPAGISTTPELDQNIGGTRPVAFEADIAQLVQLLETIAADRS